MLWLTLRLSMTLLLLTGCAGIGQGAAESCSWVSPIFLSPTDHLSADTARQLYIHNEDWRRICRQSPSIPPVR